MIDFENIYVYMKKDIVINASEIKNKLNEDDIKDMDEETFKNYLYDFIMEDDYIIDDCLSDVLRTNYEIEIL